MSNARKYTHEKGIMVVNRIADGHFVKSACEDILEMEQDETGRPIRVDQWDVSTWHREAATDPDYPDYPDFGTMLESAARIRNEYREAEIRDEIERVMAEELTGDAFLRAKFKTNALIRMWEKLMELERPRELNINATMARGEIAFRVPPSPRFGDETD